MRSSTIGGKSVLPALGSRGTLAREPDAVRCSEYTEGAKNTPNSFDFNEKKRMFIAWIEGNKAWHILQF